MTVNIYWSYLEPLKSISPNWPVSGFLEAEEPSPLVKNIDTNIKNSGYNLCPAARSYMQNTYVVRSPINFCLTYDTKGPIIQTNDYNQTFFDKMIADTALADNVLQIVFPFSYFSDKPIKVTQISPYMHNKKSGVITQHGSLLSGEFDIGKWFRNLSVALYLNEDQGVIDIKKGDILFYIKIDTSEKIKFHKYYPSRELFDIYDMLQNGLVNKPKTKVNSLLQNYNIFSKNSVNKKILKIIKNNLV